METELAANVDFGFGPMLDPYLMQASATVRPGVKIEAVERAIFNELDKVATKPIGDNEFENVLKQTRAQYVYVEDGVVNHGYRLGMLDVVASYKMYDTFLDNLEKVSKADVQRVATKYLDVTNRYSGLVHSNGRRYNSGQQTETTPVSETRWSKSEKAGNQKLIR